jgi:LysR family hydrogen peroxide-inducible transcriptional activator
MRPHDFSLRQLQYAVAVADEGGFRAAARRCRVSQPSLSAQLQALEGVLGARLFERGRGPVLLTAAGKELVRQARRVLLAADELVAAAERLAAPRAATLRIGIIPTVAPYLLPRAMPAIRQKRPALQIRWMEERTEALLRDLEEGAVDAALVARVPRMSRFETAELIEDRFLLAAPKTHALAARSGPARIADLEGETLLLLDEGHCLRDQALAVCSRARAHEADFRATSLGTLAQMVAGGAGITLLPELSIAVENPRGALVTRPFAAPAPSRTLVLAWRRQFPLAPLLRELTAEIASALRRS